MLTCTAGKLWSPALRPSSTIGFMRVSSWWNLESLRVSVPFISLFVESLRSVPWQIVLGHASWDWFCMVKLFYVYYEESEPKVLIEFSISMKVDVHGEGKRWTLNRGGIMHPYPNLAFWVNFVCSFFLYNSCDSPPKSIFCLLTIPLLVGQLGVFTLRFIEAAKCATTFKYI